MTGLLTDALHQLKEHSSIFRPCFKLIQNTNSYKDLTGNNCTGFQLKSIFLYSWQCFSYKSLKTFLFFQKGGALFNTAVTKATPAVRTAYKFVSFISEFQTFASTITRMSRR